MDVALYTSPMLKQAVETTTRQMELQGYFIHTEIRSMEILINPIANHMLLQPF